MLKFEEIILKIIAEAGQSKSLCYQALRVLNEGDLEQAREHLARAEELLRGVHEVHAGLLHDNVIPSDPKEMFLLVHAEDIFMSTMTEKELIKGFLNYVENNRACKNSDDNK